MSEATTIEKKNIGSGHWFMDTFESCPWKGFLRYILKLEPIYTPPALSWGRAIHAGVAAFLTTSSLTSTAEAFAASMKLSQQEYENPEQWETDLVRGGKLLELYARKYENEQAEFELIASEADLTPEIDGIKFHFRADAITRSRRTGVIELREIKTSSSLTPEKVFGKVRDQDQITGYMYAWNLLHPDQQIEIAVPDVLYNNKGVYDCARMTSGVYDCARMTSGVYRSRAEQEQWAKATVAWCKELAQRVKTLAAGADPHILFKRAFSCDGDGFFRCDYKSICRVPLSFTEIPYGFKRRVRDEA